MPSIPKECTVEWLVVNSWKPDPDYAAIEMQENLIGDSEAAFELLHRLQHLNSASFYIAYRLNDLNTSIFETLIRYNRSIGGRYRLHLESYDLVSIDKALSPPSILLPVGRGTAIRDCMCIRAGQAALQLSPEDMGRVEEVISSVGRYCRKLVFDASRFGPQHVDEFVQVSELDLGYAVGISHIAKCLHLQLAKSYRPPISTAFCPVRRVRLRIIELVEQAWPLSLPRPIFSQLREKPLRGERKFEFVDPASSRRFKVGVDQWADGVNYRLRSVSFTLP